MMGGKANAAGGHTIRWQLKRGEGLVWHIDCHENADAPCRSGGYCNFDDMARYDGAEWLYGGPTVTVHNGRVEFFSSDDEWWWRYTETPTPGGHCSEHCPEQCEGGTVTEGQAYHLHGPDMYGAMWVDRCPYCAGAAATREQASAAISRVSDELGAGPVDECEPGSPLDAAIEALNVAVSIVEGVEPKWEQRLARLSWNRPR